MTAAPDLPAAIGDHVDGCACPRCEGLEKCPVCGRQKLDTGDWCWAERRLVFLPGVGWMTSRLGLGRGA